MIEKLKNLDIKLLILDVDGVLTDGNIYYADDGIQIKSFNVKDGFGLRQLIKNNIEIAIISGKKSQATQIRMNDLGIEHVHLGITDKLKPFEELKKQLKINNENIAYIGDDLPDIAVMEQIGFSVAVADAVPEVLEIADYVTTLDGGDGAVREVCDLILKSNE